MSPKRFCCDQCKQQASLIRRVAKLLEGLSDDGSVDDSTGREVTDIQDRIFQLASAILAASENVSVGQAIRLAVKIVSTLDGYQPRESDEEEAHHR
jgi:hypothetical protein